MAGCFAVCSLSPCRREFPVPKSISFIGLIGNRIFELKVFLYFCFFSDQ
ncbi:hypothetical protein X474_13855 [Dethiosulfatarculus sandiegensis]|uniref:Uncharacterized protein n=1 Tax=Dethiosulfatarculus sandiegensis TaxID=1429043 RepID=A0A0D2JCT6_9BACT|nr:hypothetical protein X474_13855 [Dethiosulfatarculus sandiegensis]